MRQISLIRSILHYRSGRNRQADRRHHSLAWKDKEIESMLLIRATRSIISTSITILSCLCGNLSHQKGQIKNTTQCLAMTTLALHSNNNASSSNKTFWRIFKPLFSRSTMKVYVPAMQTQRRYLPNKHP